MYQDIIREIASSAYNARHIEAFMRDLNGTLDHLSPAEFISEVRAAEDCIRIGGEYQAERLADGMGI